MTLNYRPNQEPIDILGASASLIFDLNIPFGVGSYSVYKNNSLISEPKTESLQITILVNRADKIKVVALISDLDKNKHENTTELDVDINGAKSPMIRKYKFNADNLGLVIYEINYLVV
jgi:hypothetical protein